MSEWLPRTRWSKENDPEIQFNKEDRSSMSAPAQLRNHVEHETNTHNHVDRFENESDDDEFYDSVDGDRDNDFNDEPIIEHHNHFVKNVGSVQGDGDHVTQDRLLNCTHVHNKTTRGRKHDTRFNDHRGYQYEPSPPRYSRVQNNFEDTMHRHHAYKPNAFENNDYSREYSPYKQVNFDRHVMRNYNDCDQRQGNRCLVDKQSRYDVNTYIKPKVTHSYQTFTPERQQIGHNTYNKSHVICSYPQFMPEIQQIDYNNYHKPQVVHSYPQFTPELMGPMYQSRYNSGTKMHKRKPKDPKLFDGVKIEWSDYLKHFLSVADWNEWEEDEMAKQLTMSFDGDALKLLGELDDQILKDFPLLVQELNRRFDPSEQAEAWKIKFRTRTKQTKESFMIFAQDLTRMANKAYFNLDKTAQEQWVLDQFIAGLDSQMLKQHVQFNHPQNVNQAISLAIEYEAFQNAHQDKYQKPQFGDLNFVKNDNSELKRLQAEVTELKQIVRRQNQNQSNQKQYQNFQMDNSVYPTDSIYVRKNDMKDVECYFCKRKGHMKDDCWKLKAKIERENKMNGQTQLN